MHPDLDAFSPLGYANQLFLDTDSPVGAATVSYLLIPQ
jgi:hypothetical protein